MTIIINLMAFMMLLNLITALRRVEGGKQLDLYNSSQQIGWVKGVIAVLYGIVALLAVNHALGEPFAFSDAWFLPAIFALLLLESAVSVYYRLKGLLVSKS